MPAKTIGVGALLVAVGAVVSVLSDSDSITSWIPAFIGGAFVLLGVLATVMKDQRPHFMHAAAALALIAILATLGRMISAGTSGWAAVSQVLLLLICGGYMAAAVDSFRSAAAARRVAKDALDG